jgi:hypothetical protein
MEDIMKLINILESILLSICIIMVVLSFTLFNTRFIIHEFTKHDYYQMIKDNINKEVDVEYTIDDSLLKNDVNSYINGYFNDRSFTNKIMINEDVIPSKYDEIYNRNIKVIGPYKNVRMIKDIFDVATIIMLIVTGTILNKTKKKHNINTIGLITSITGIIISFIILYTMNYGTIINGMVKDIYYVYLGFNILLLITPIYLSVYNKIVKKK